MVLTDTFQEDLVSNAVLGLGMVLFFCCRDLCKRVSHSECLYDAANGGLRVKLPTYRKNSEDDDDRII